MYLNLFYSLQWCNINSNFILAQYLESVNLSINSLLEAVKKQKSNRVVTLVQTSNSQNVRVVAMNMSL